MLLLLYPTFHANPCTAPHRPSVPQSESAVLVSLQKHVCTFAGYATAGVDCSVKKLLPHSHTFQVVHEAPGTRCSEPNGGRAQHA